ncbi:Dna-directed Dna polymerase [Cardiosporidium cionae]|uniref:Dna-directed Dna polymerase n=1 Tax=Cardiosporidium cionae TaxID=476202 RepID=A0ABQ7JBA6_9APIC|nr:Dna-directed Dna polymerase [Cardiosporidium cionae]|eukprot:KAF8821238.1 Dna-directed Dna polymerase [Cardiosporidium cionae]
MAAVDRTALGSESYLICDDVAHKQRLSNQRLRVILKKIKNRAEASRKESSENPKTERDCAAIDGIQEFMRFPILNLTTEEDTYAMPRNRRGAGQSDNVSSKELNATTNRISDDLYESRNIAAISFQEKRKNKSTGDKFSGKPAKSERFDTSSSTKQLKRSEAPFSEIVWLSTERCYRKNSDFFYALHEEIIDLLHWLELTYEENQQRLRILAQMKVVSRMIWPKSSVHSFGSFYTGLTLPNGDLDICIRNVEGRRRNNLTVLATFLQRYQLAMSGSVSLILDARVPIIKFMDRSSGIRVDVCIDEESALRTSEFVREQLKRYPHLRPLIIFSKLFLQQRQFGDTFTGGVGSYLLFVMCLAFLQLNANLSSYKSTKKLSLGHLLFQFYRFFGCDYNYEMIGISVLNQGSLFKKSSRVWENGSSTLLTVESPLRSTYNLGKSAFKMDLIQLSWRNAFRLLARRSKDFCDTGKGNAANHGQCISLLEGIVNPKNSIFLFRQQSFNHSALGGNQSVSDVKAIPGVPAEMFVIVEKEITAKIRARSSQQHQNRKRENRRDNAESQLKFRRYI